MKRFYILPLFLAFIFTHLQTIVAQTVNKTTDVYEEVKSIQSIQRGKQIFFAGSEKNENVIVSAFSEDLIKLWDKQIKGNLIAFQNLANGLLLLVSTDFSKSKGPNNTLIAYVLDFKSGSVKAEKTIFSDDDEFLITQKVIVSKDQKTFSLASRKTLTQRMYFTPVFVVSHISESQKFIKELNTSSFFTVNSFNQSLDPISKLALKLPQGDVIDIVKAPNNDIFIATVQGNTLVNIAKYEAGQENFSEVITDSLNYSTRDELNSLYKLLHLNSDSIKNNIVYLNGTLPQNKRSVCVFNMYNFGSKEHNRFTKIITRDDLKVIEKNYKPLTKAYSFLSLGDAETLQIIGVLPSENGYFLILSDISFYPRSAKADGYAFRTDNSGRTTYSPGQIGSAVYRSNTFPAGGLMIYSLDKKLNFISMSTVPRETDLVFQPEFKAWRKDGSWYLFATAGYYSQCIMAKLNAATGNVEEIKTIQPTKASQSHFVSLNHAFFTDKRITLPLRAHKVAISGIKFDLDVHQFNWDLLMK